VALTDLRHTGNKPGTKTTSVKALARTNQDLPALPSRPKLMRPAYLTQAEQKVWNRVVKSVGKHDWFTAADQPTLVLYVRTYVEWEKWSRDLQKFFDRAGGGLIEITTPIERALKREQALSARLMRLEVQLGISIPTDRRLSSKKIESIEEEVAEVASDIDELAVLRAQAAHAQAGSMM